MRALHGPVYRRRLAGLVQVISPHLRDGDRLLDVGCGQGTLAQALTQRSGKKNIQAQGLERYPRGGEVIPVTGYAGGAMPFDDDAFDVVTIADVLHHEPDPQALLAECLRVAKRRVIVKDHSPGSGNALSRAWAQKRIAIMDWAANAPYGVKCLYQYPTHAGWRERFQSLGAQLHEERCALSLYPFPYTAFFTPGLQYFAVLHPPPPEVAPEEESAA